MNAPNDRRMITQDICTDTRLWEHCSKKARSLFPFVIPNIAINGTIERDARRLRFKCFPLENITDEETESLIKEWIKSKICSDRDERLFFFDFDRCNSGLKSVRQRKWRANALVDAGRRW